MVATGRYLLGHSSAEIRHLVEQAEVYAEEANALFDTIDVAPGIDAIDVGCGVMGVLHVLAERVGPSGRVLGLDREPRMVEAGQRLAAERGLPVEFVEADATSIGLPAESFDLVHTRTLLLNVDNPQAVVAEMLRIARHGATIAVQEPDASAWTCDPPHPAWDILRTAILDGYRRAGKDFNIGRRIGRILREAGVEDVRLRATARITKPGDYYHTFLLTISSLVRELIVTGGQIDGDEFDSYRKALRTHLNDPITTTCQPLMYQAWGRVANRPCAEPDLRTGSAAGSPGAIQADTGPGSGRAPTATPTTATDEAAPLGRGQLAGYAPAPHRD